MWPKFFKSASITTILSAALWLALSTAPIPTVSARSCGLKPLKPLPPLGCSDLRAECICDEKGKNCKWQWICVKD